MIFTYTLYAEIKIDYRLVSTPKIVGSISAVADFFFCLVLFPFTVLAGINAHLTFYGFASALKRTFQS